MTHYDQTALESSMALQANAGRLLVHQVATRVSAEVDALARTFRGPGRYVRGDQMVRAALSVTSNIAEACGRGTVREFRQFIRYARGSAHELRSQLQSLLTSDDPRRPEVRGLESRVTLVIKMLNRLHDRPPPSQ